MFKWLTNLFQKPHITDTWKAAPNLTIQVEFSTATLLINDTRVEIGAPVQELSLLGPPSTKPETESLMYLHFGLFCTIFEGVFEGFSIGIEDDVRPQLLLHGKPIEIDGLTAQAVVATFGPPRDETTEEWGDIVETMLTYEPRPGVLADWTFEKGKLTYLEFLAELEEDDEPADDAENGSAAQKKTHPDELKDDEEGTAW